MSGKSQDSTENPCCPVFVEVVTTSVLTEDRNEGRGVDCISDRGDIFRPQQDDVIPPFHTYSDDITTITPLKWLALCSISQLRVMLWALFTNSPFHAGS